MRTSTFSANSCTRSDSARTSMVSLRSVASATSGWLRSAVRKSGAVIDPTVASVSAITLADRGWPSIADSSPKLCPGVELAEGHLAAGFGEDGDLQLARSG